MRYRRGANGDKLNKKGSKPLSGTVLHFTHYTINQSNFFRFFSDLNEGDF
jgi:hypothetical protein